MESKQRTSNQYRRERFQAFHSACEYWPRRRERLYSSNWGVAAIQGLGLWPGCTLWHRIVACRYLTVLFSEPLSGCELVLGACHAVDQDLGKLGNVVGIVGVDGDISGEGQDLSGICIHRSNLAVEARIETTSQWA